METFQHWRSLHGWVILMFLATVSEGSACEAPSSPRCFRKNEMENIYICDWSFNTSDSNVSFDLYFNANIGKTKIGSFKENHTKIVEESLIVFDNVDMWVEAHAGNCSSTSPVRSGILNHSVKYDAPENISVSWLRNNLRLSWSAASKYTASAEVWFRQYEHPIESWEKRLINTTNVNSTYKIIIVNLLKFSAYQVQIRHRSNEAKNPLWSNWSPVITVPAELEHEPEVSDTTRLLNGSRKVMLTWKSMPPAAALRGVTYSVKDTQSSRGCPCKQKKRDDTSSNKYSVYVSYSAVNITVTATNAAGESPPATIQVPAASAAHLKICDKTLLNEKLKKKTCLELYELQDAALKPGSVGTLTARKQKKERKDIQKNIKDFTRYLYFEHRCVNGNPQTVKMCLFYKTEGVPNKEPEDFKVVAETDSASLFWREISYEHQRGFLTHYSLCNVKISPPKELKECFNISASETQHHLKNLTPGTKYNISLAGVTRAGEGLPATQTIRTLPEKSVNVWLSFGLLLVFFLFSTLCTVVLKKIKNKILPPVPRPVIPDFPTCKPKSEQEQETWERKEEVHELTLHQLLPEQQRSAAEETSALRGEWDGRADEDLEEERSDSAGSDVERSSLHSADETLRKPGIIDLVQVEAELAMLIYRNGLVFDVKSESV